MKKIFKITIVFLCLLLPSLAVAQDEDEKPFPKVPKTVNKPEEFAPKDWKVEKVVQGDLNGDGKADVALTLTNGENGYDDKTQKSTFLTRVLVLAFRGADGKLTRSAVSADAVYDGDEGGVMGDPFQELEIKGGTVVINHYGGSRNRWGYTHVYRWQQDKWMLIGETDSSMDTLDLDFEDTTDINLSTGLVNARFSGELDQQTGKRSRGKSGSYYQLQVMPQMTRPVVDGKVDTNVWQGYSVELDRKKQVYKGVWANANDLSAKLTGVCVLGDFYLLAEVTDNEFTNVDTVRLKSNKGIEIKPKETKTTKTANGYIVESRYSILDLARATFAKGDYALEHLEEVLPNLKNVNELGGTTLEASIEVVDFDAGKAGATMSTRLLNSAYTGSIRILPLSTAILTDSN